MSEKTSVVWLITTQALQAILDSSSSFVEVLKKLRLNPYSGNHRTLQKRLAQEGSNLDLTKLTQNRKVAQSLHSQSLATPLEDILAGKYPDYDAQTLKQRLFKTGLLEAVCQKCGTNSTWMGEPLSLQIHHIDGNNSNHTLQNLMVLCPNCHSQTGTFCGKNIKHKRPSYFCIDCGCPVGAKGSRCRSCAATIGNEKNRRFFLTRLELAALIWEKPLIQIAEDLKVSDKTVEKWRNKFKISKPPHGYWGMTSENKQKIKKSMGSE